MLKTIRFTHVAVAAALTVAPVDAWSDEAAVTLAQASERSFDIAAQPLADALARFGRQSDLQVSVDADIARRVRSAGISGRMSVDEALDTLLGGTGLRWERLDQGTILVRRPGVAQGGGVMELGPVVVEGAGRYEQAVGPVEGFVASRSATATKTDTAILETPQSISVIGREQMEARGVQRLDDALRYSANVNASTYWNSATSDPFSIRNFDATTLRDGMRAFNNGFDSVVEPYGVERIEVLRGPAAALYGQSEAGGLVNTVTKRPLDAPLREVELQTGSFERKQIAVDIGDALDGESRNVLFRLTALGRESGTQVDHIDDDRIYIAPAITWKPDSRTEFTLLSHYQGVRSAFPTYYPLAGTLQSNPNGEIPVGRFIGEPDFDQNDKDIFSVGYDLAHSFNTTWSLHHKANYFHSDVERREIALTGLLGDQRTITRRAEFRPQSSQVVTSDTNVTGEWMTGPVEVKALAGIDILDTVLLMERWRGTATNLDIFNPVYGGAVTTNNLISDSRQEQEQIGAYMQGQFTVDENWILTLGGRHDWANMETINHVANTRQEQKDTAFTGRAGLVYRFDFGLAPYASYSESFEPVSGTNAQSQPFEPETGTQYEVGIKYQPDGFESFASVALFDITRQNVTTSDPANPGFQIQTGEVRSQGIELEAQARLDEGLDLIGAYSYTDAQVTKSNGTDLGRRPAYEPRHLASGWLDYTLQDGALEGLGAGAGVRYVGRTYSSDGAIKMPSFTLVDAALHYEWEAFDVALNVTNLFDKRYLTRCFTVGCYIGDARTVRLSATYEW